MPRIRCHYEDCVFLEEGYCGAAAIELEPETGCLTYTRVDEVSEIVKVGDEVEVKVLAVDSRKKQIKLSMKAVEVEAATETEVEEPSLTAMQLAFQRAQAGSSQNQGGRKNKGKHGRDEQEDILSRTLANRRQ